ncbi:MAG: cupredoxin domain-containing protein [Candidatus Zambryskibacteria bacterium]|nr:cupredoxin domain-containing protein [Candidatus Zambryskibacteria bacterium]
MKTVIGVIIVALVVWGIWTWMDRDEAVVPQVNQEENNSEAGGTELATREFTINASNFSFSDSEIEVNKGERVRITLTNTVGTHDLVVEGYDVRTQILQTGESETIEFIADESGTFEYYCSIGNHRAMGMTGTLTVNE